MLPTTKPEEIEQYSIRVAEAWKIGRKGVDDGLILVVAKDDRRLRIEVGYGLEGAIPDSVAKRVIDERITPRFRDGDFYGGVRDGVDQLIRLAEGEKLPPPAGAAPGAPAPADPLQLPASRRSFSSLIGGGILKAMLGRFRGSLATGGRPRRDRLVAVRPGAGRARRALPASSSLSPTPGTGAAAGRAAAVLAAVPGAAGPRRAGAAGAAASAAAALGALVGDAMRWIHHLFLDHLALARAFPRATLEAIERAVAEQEKRRHRGELRVVDRGRAAAAGAASPAARRASARSSMFTRLRVWDTEDNAGVLIYLLLADRRVEIVADRGIHARVGDTAWETICGAMQQEFAAGRFEAGHARRACRR